MTHDEDKCLEVQTRKMENIFMCVVEGYFLKNKLSEIYFIIRRIKLNKNLKYVYVNCQESR